MTVARADALVKIVCDAQGCHLRRRRDPFLDPRFARYSAGRHPVCDAIILFVGCGNMGGAMLAGWLRCGVPASSVTMIDPVCVRLLSTIPANRTPPSVLVLAVNPQKRADLAPDLTPLASPDTILVSALAAVEPATLRHHFPAAGQLVRAVPNLPAAIGDELVECAMDESGLPAQGSRVSAVGLWDGCACSPLSSALANGWTRRSIRRSPTAPLPRLICAVAMPLSARWRAVTPRRRLPLAARS